MLVGGPVSLRHRPNYRRPNMETELIIMSSAYSVIAFVLMSTLLGLLTVWTLIGTLALAVETWHEQRARKRDTHSSQ